MSDVKPNEVAVENSLSYLRIIFERGLFPSNTGTYVEGGIGLTFYGSEGRYAYVEFYNDGAVCTLTDTEGHKRETFEGLGSEAADLTRSVDHILKHLR